MPHPSIRPLQASKHVFFLLFGMPSIGKTVMIGSTPGRVLLLRPPTDHTDSIRNPHAGLREWVIRDWAEMDEAKNYLKMDGGKEFDWVWLDSISLWQDIGLADVWEATLEKKPARALLDPTGGMDKGEYGRNMERIKLWVQEVVGLDEFNFGISAHPSSKLDDPTGERRMMPWIQGKGMATGICGYMTIIGYLEARRNQEGGETYRVLHTEMTDDFYCKNQYAAVGQPWLPIKNPSMPGLLKLIEQNRKPTTPVAPVATATPARRRRAA